MFNSQTHFWFPLWDARVIQIIFFCLILWTTIAKKTKMCCFGSILLPILSHIITYFWLVFSYRLLHLHTNAHLNYFLHPSNYHEYSHWESKSKLAKMQRKAQEQLPIWQTIPMWKISSHWLKITRFLSIICRQRSKLQKRKLHFHLEAQSHLILEWSMCSAWELKHIQ